MNLFEIKHLCSSRAVNLRVAKRHSSNSDLPRSQFCSNRTGSSRLSMAARLAPQVACA
jgi:hypothetical protein